VTNAWDRDQPAVVYLRGLVASFFPAVGLFHDATLTVDPKVPGLVRNHPAQGVGGAWYVQRPTGAFLGTPKGGQRIFIAIPAMLI
jgi:hypothetical protein